MANADKGLFITVEGGEGVGKTTNMAFIEQSIRARGLELLCTREPGGTPLAEDIREVLLAPRTETMMPDAELLLVFAARAQHLGAVIQPALEAGSWVLCDRFTDATYAYQGGGRALPEETIAALETLVQKGLQADMTLLLDIDPELGMERARQRSALDRFERESLAFFQRVREAYLKRAEQAPQRFRLIDASQPLEAVQRDIAEVLDELFRAAGSQV